MSILRNPLALLGLLVFVWSCSDDLDLQQNSFTRIYDDSNAEVDYRPTDIAETANGFIIIAENEIDQSAFPGIQLLVVDKEGAFVRSTTLENNLVLPTRGLFLLDSTFYFFGMNRTTLEAVLIAVDESLSGISSTSIPGLFYPLSAAATENGQFLLESYDPLNFLTDLSVIGTDGSIQATAGFNIGEGQDFEQTIIDHYLDPEVKLPFFCGEMSSGSYFFNGFYNFSLSFVFSNLGSANPNGVVQGQSDDGGIRAAAWLSGNDFALMGYQFDENYVTPSTTVSTAGITSSIDLFTSEQAEIRTGSSGLILRYDEQHVVVAAETESREVVLYFYDYTQQELKSIQTIGFLNPFNLGSIRMDAEGNLLIVGTTLVAGRFERIFFRKITASEVLEAIN